MKKRISALLMAVCLLILPCSAALEIPSPTRDFFVNDYADVISPADEITMQAAAENLYHACGAQVVVVTLPTLEGEEIADVSLRLAREWGIGQKDKNNGLLLLFAADEVRVRIEVGSGLEGAIPDSKAGRLLDTYMLAAYPDYSTGLTDTQNALVNETYIEYGLSPEEDYTPIEYYESEYYENELTLSEIIGAIILIIGAIVLFIRHPSLFFWLLHFLSHHGGRGGRGGFGGGRGGGRGGFSGGGGGFSGGGASR